MQQPQRWAGPGSVACSTTLCQAAYVTFPALSALQAPSEEPWLCLCAPLWRALYLVRAVLGSPELPHSPTSWPATLRTFKFIILVFTRLHLRALLSAHCRDGIWIDMDEISNFCTGDICELRKHPSKGGCRRWGRCVGVASREKGWRLNTLCCK